MSDDVLVKRLSKVKSHMSHRRSTRPETVFLQDHGIAALPHSFRKCRNRISPRGHKGQRKKKNALCNISANVFNINQNFIGYGVFIKTLKIYYLRKYEVFTLTQSSL